MKSNRIISALGDVDEKYIAEAAPSEPVVAGAKIVKPKPLVWRFAPVAACAVVAVAAVLIVGQNGFFQNATSPAVDNNMVVAQNDPSRQGVDATLPTTDNDMIVAQNDISGQCVGDGAIAVQEAAYNFLIGNRVYAPIDFNSRKVYGLVARTDIGLTPENTYEITEQDIGESFGMIDYSSNPALVGKTVYHFSQYPNDDNICIVEVYNPAPSSDYISTTDEYTNDKYRFYVFSYTDLAASHTLSDTILEANDVAADSVVKITLHAIVGDEYHSEMVEVGEVDSSLATEILSILSGKTSISKQELDQLYPDFDGQKMFAFVTSSGNKMFWTFDSSANIVSGADCYYQLSEKESNALSDLLSVD